MWYNCINLRPLKPRKQTKILTDDVSLFFASFQKIMNHLTFLKTSKPWGKHTAQHLYKLPGAKRSLDPPKKRGLTLLLARFFWISKTSVTWDSMILRVVDVETPLRDMHPTNSLHHNRCSTFDLSLRSMVISTTKRTGEHECPTLGAPEKVYVYKYIYTHTKKNTSPQEGPFQRKVVFQPPCLADIWIFAGVVAKFNSGVYLSIKPNLKTSQKSLARPKQQETCKLTHTHTNNKLKHQNILRDFQKHATNNIPGVKNHGGEHVLWQSNHLKNLGTCFNLPLKGHTP